MKTETVNKFLLLLVSVQNNHLKLKLFTSLKFSNFFTWRVLFISHVYTRTVYYKNFYHILEMFSVESIHLKCFCFA